jgi:hypothetical protein
MKYYLVSGLIFLASAGAVYAQFAPPQGGCPPGMHMEGFSCVYDRPPQPAEPPPPQWETRWGAIAIGSTAAGSLFGASENMNSKRRAEAAAIKHCKSRDGGQTCKKVFSYFDQCAAVAWGTQRYTIQGAETIAIASKLAMQRCNGQTEDCQIFYSACSYPVRVR